MPQVSAALVRSAPSKTIASANIRRDAALSFSRPAAARSSMAVKSLRVTAIAAIVLAPHHTKSSSIQTFSDSGTPTSHPFSPLVLMVARHYDVNANQVFSWRRLYRDEPRVSAVASTPQLIPVMVTAEQDAVTTQASTVAETIEIDLAGKYRIRVSSGVDAAALRRVLDVLERRR
jgi:transposase